MHAQSVLTQIHSVIDITNSQLKLDPWRRLSHVATAASQCHRATEQTAESLPAGTAPTHTRSLTHQQNKHPPLSPQSLSLSRSLSLSLVPWCHCLSFHLPNLTQAFGTHTVTLQSPHSLHRQQKVGRVSPQTTDRSICLSALWNSHSSLLDFLFCVPVSDKSKQCPVLSFHSLLYRLCPSFPLCFLCSDYAADMGY